MHLHLVRLVPSSCPTALFPRPALLLPTESKFRTDAAENTFKYI